MLRFSLRLFLMSITFKISRPAVFFYTRKKRAADQWRCVLDLYVVLCYVPNKVNKFIWKNGVNFKLLNAFDHLTGLPFAMMWFEGFCVQFGSAVLRLSVRIVGMCVVRTGEGIMLMWILIWDVFDWISDQRVTIVCRLSYFYDCSLINLTNLFLPWSDCLSCECVDTWAASSRRAADLSFIIYRCGWGESETCLVRSPSLQTRRNKLNKTFFKR